MDGEKEHITPQRKKERRLIVAIVLFILMLWSLSWSLNLYFFDRWQDRGTFGDMFGAINSLFSGLAFAGLIFTVYLQRRELEFQRKELELTRKQVERSANAQEKSEKALSQQVEALYLTAKLTSLNALISLCNERLNEVKDANEQPSSISERMRLENQLRETLERIEDKTRTNFFGIF